MQGDFGGNLAVRMVAKTENPRMLSKMGKSKAIISGMGIQLGIHYCEWGIPFMDVPETKRFLISKEIWELYHLEIGFGNMEKERDNLGNLKVWLILRRGKG